MLNSSSMQYNKYYVKVFFKFIFEDTCLFR